MYILEMYVIYPLRFLRNFYMHVFIMVYWRRDVYFLNIVLFACFIALIEIGRYNKHQGEQT